MGLGPTVSRCCGSMAWDVSLLRLCIDHLSYLFFGRHLGVGLPRLIDPHLPTVGHGHAGECCGNGNGAAAGCGDVEIEGYGMQRELTWSENLDAGVNRLSLPVLANGLNGGQMIVRMAHPMSEQVFVINLPAES